ncbi:MAG: hypothetical protein EOP00_09375 [Pedobacter sp.]|nr:MAG: hypothetical protein EOP00_09375 [Pedobacter sp.]
MKSFEIQLSANRFLIEPQENGTFRIMEGEKKLGVVYPEPGDDGVIWQTMDELAPDFVSQIGELITEFQHQNS